MADLTAKGSTTTPTRRCVRRAGTRAWFSGWGGLLLLALTASGKAQAPAAAGGTELGSPTSVTEAAPTPATVGNPLEVAREHMERGQGLYGAGRSSNPPNFCAPTRPSPSPRLFNAGVSSGRRGRWCVWCVCVCVFLFLLHLLASLRIAGPCPTAGSRLQRRGGLRPVDLGDLVERLAGPGVGVGGGEGGVPLGGTSADSTPCCCGQVDPRTPSLSESAFGRAPARTARRTPPRTWRPTRAAVAAATSAGPR